VVGDCIQAPHRVLDPEHHGDEGSIDDFDVGESRAGHEWLAEELRNVRKAVETTRFNQRERIGGDEADTEKTDVRKQRQAKQPGRSHNWEEWIHAGAVLRAEGRGFPPTYGLRHSTGIIGTEPAGGRR